MKSLGKNKIGFIVISHISNELRPKGDHYLFHYLDTLFDYIEKSIDFTVYVIDNGSEGYEALKVLKYFKEFHDQIVYHRIDDQFIGGITGAWETGNQLALDDGCDIVVLCNDDIKFNGTVNTMIQLVEQDDNRDNTYYGVMSNGILAPSKQYSQVPKYESFELSGNTGHDVINGFLTVHTRGFHDKFAKDGKLYYADHPHNAGDGKWGGQEGLQFIWKEQGARLLVLGQVWFEHTKERGWINTRNKDRSSETNV